MTIVGVTRWLFADRVRDRGAVPVAVLRVVVGLVFVLFSLPKFVLHEFELSEFVRFGLPASSLLVYAVGVLELVGGVALVVGLATRLAAVGLALNMAGAVATAGVRVGGPLHLGLAPALLVALLVLLWAGAGAASVDRRLAARAAARSSAPAPSAGPTPYGDRGPTVTSRRRSPGA